MAVFRDLLIIASSLAGPSQFQYLNPVTGPELYHLLVIGGVGVVIDPCAPYSPESATGDIFELGDAESEAENVTAATGGIFELCNEII